MNRKRSEFHRSNRFFFLNDDEAIRMRNMNKMRMDCFVLLQINLGINDTNYMRIKKGRRSQPHSEMIHTTSADARQQCPRAQKMK